MNAERPYFIVNVEAAIRAENKYLLIKRGQHEEHSPGTLSLPGGKVETNAVSPNALEDALRREVLEEVGLELGDMRYMESKTFVMDTGEICLSVCFLSEDFEGVPMDKNIDEVAGFEWLSIEAVQSNEKAPPWTKQSLLAAEKAKYDKNL